MDSESREHRKEKLQALLNDCLKGNRRAQQRFFKRFYGPLFAICMRYAGNREEAEDMVSEGFIKIFGHLENYRDTGSFEGWLKTIVVNTAIDYQRKYGKGEEMVPCDEMVENFTTREENNAIAKMSNDELMQLIQQLPPMSRQVFNLFVFEGYSHAEIADLLAIKEGTSCWHLNNARTLLKEKIEKLYR